MSDEANELRPACSGCGRSLSSQEVACYGGSKCEDCDVGECPGASGTPFERRQLMGTRHGSDRRRRGRDVEGR